MNQLTRTKKKRGGWSGENSNFLGVKRNSKVKLSVFSASFKLFGLISFSFFYENKYILGLELTYRNEAFKEIHGYSVNFFA